MWYPTAHARLRLVGVGETVVNVPAHAQVEEPVAGLDLVFDVQRQFLHVGVAEVVRIRCRRGSGHTARGPRGSWDSETRPRRRKPMGSEYPGSGLPLTSTHGAL